MTENPGSADTGGLPGAPPSLDYECLRRIGQGGYGEVWLVRDQAGRHLACKVIYRASFDNDRPYEREYEGIKKFEPVSGGSESQVRILHVGRRDAAGYFYYVMELADDVETGQQINPAQYVPKTLKTELSRRGRLPANECVRIGLSLSAALENLHGHGLIHRDIKPANIIFVHGIPKLADIGLVTDADVTVSYVGTEGYIPPEGPGSKSGDLYGLGKVLYEMSTGRDRLDYPELPTALGELPDREALLELNAVILKGCQKNPALRYQTAGELHAELTVLTGGKSIRRVRRNQGRWKTARRAGLAVLGLFVIAGGFLYFQKQRTQNEAPSPAQQMVRLPAPPPSDVARKEADLWTKYGPEMNESQRSAAVAELLQQSAGATDPVMAMASLRVAETLEMQAGHFYPALKICETVLLRFQMDPVAAKLELVTRGSAFPVAPKSKGSFAEICVATAFEAIAADDYKHAATLAGLAENAAQLANDDHIQWQVGFLQSELARDQAGFARVQSALETLRTKPDDPTANLAMGKFLCFVKNDWPAGLPRLVLGNDPALTDVLVAELDANARLPANEQQAGDAWWTLAASAVNEDALPFRERARYWYLKAIAHSREPEKSRLRQLLRERIQSVPVRAGEVHLFARVVGTERIEIYADKIRWQSNKGSLAARVNDLTPGDLKPGETRIIINTGATRMYPQSIDFSTAQFVVDHKAKRGRASLEIADDHVLVILADPRVGKSDIEVTVRFTGEP